MSSKIKIEDLSNEISKEIQNYAQDQTDKLIDAVKDVAQETVEELKKTSPKNTGTYARSWKQETVHENKFGARVVVYNKKYQLTHLLEYGHVKRNGGRTQAKPHIKPAEEEAVKKVIERMKKV